LSPSIPPTSLNVIAGRSGLSQAAGTALNVTINAVDADWNLVSTITDTVGLTCSDANAALPPSSALVGGTRILSVTFKTATPQTLTASDITDPAKTANASPSVTVNPGAFTKLQLLLPGENAAPGTTTGKTSSPNAQTAGTAFTVTVEEVGISAGAGFLVPITGEIMTMPGLPKRPAAEQIDIDEAGRIVGLA